jgi:hypothetical protein
VMPTATVAQLIINKLIYKFIFIYFWKSIFSQQHCNI